MVRGFQKIIYSAKDVKEFAWKWPCSNLPFVPITFEFRVNDNGTLGDLVDITGIDRQLMVEETDRALKAMAEDARAGVNGKWVQS